MLPGQSMAIARRSAGALALAAAAWAAGCATPRPLIEPAFAARTYTPLRIALLPPDVFIVVDQYGDNDDVQSAAMGQAVSGETVRLVTQALKARGYDVDLSARWDGIAAADGSLVVSRDELGALAGSVLQFANADKGGAEGPMPAPHFVAPELAARVGWATQSDALMYVNLKGITTTSGKRAAQIFGAVFFVVVIAAIVALVVMSKDGGSRGGGSTSPASVGGGGGARGGITRATPPAAGGGSPMAVGAPSMNRGGASPMGAGAPSMNRGGASPMAAGAPGMNRGGASPMAAGAPGMNRSGASPMAAGAPGMNRGGASPMAAGAPSMNRGGASPMAAGAPAVNRGAAAPMEAGGAPPMAAAAGSPTTATWSTPRGRGSVPASARPGRTWGGGPNVHVGVGIHVPLYAPIYTHDGAVTHDDEYFGGDEVYVSLTLVSAADGRVLWHVSDHVDREVESPQELERMFTRFIDTIPYRGGGVVAPQ